MWIADKLIYRSEDDFMRAYQGSELVWELPSGLYYVSWTPKSLSGTFSLFGETLSLQDYSGYYYWTGNGIITSSAFQSTGIKTLKTNVSMVNTMAFADCVSLSRAALPECKNIYSSVFSGCTSLDTVYLPKAQTISSKAFEGTVTGLDVVLEGSSVCSFTGNIFGSSGFGNHMIFVPSSMVSTYIATYPSYYHPSQGQGTFPSYPLFASLYYMKWTPDITGTGTFSLSWDGSTYTYSLSKYTYDNYFVCPFMINGVVSRMDITSSAFKNKSMIETFETNATGVGESAFYGCSNLKTLTLPDCSYISLYAFANCTAMESITFGYSSVVTFTGNSNAFSNNSTKIYVPSSLVTAYKSHPLWSYFKYRIFAIPS